MIPDMSGTVRDGKATVAFISLSTGPIPVAGAWPICLTVITIHGVTIRSPIVLTTACRIITRVITASTFMSALAGIGPVGIGIAGTTGTAAIPITGTEPMSLPNRPKA